MYAIKTRERERERGKDGLCLHGGEVRIGRIKAKP